MTYDELRQALHDYMHRTDTETVSYEVVAIELARLKLGRSFFPELASSAVALLFANNGDGTASAPLPLDFGQADTVYLGGQGDLEFMTTREFARRWGDKRLAGAYTIWGSGAAGASSLAGQLVTLTYYRQPMPILGDETNWCSYSYADVWLWQAIAEQHRFVQDAESAQLAEAYSEELAAAATRQTRANRQGGALRMSTR